MGLIQEFKSTFYKKGTNKIDRKIVITTIVLITGLIVFEIFKENQRNNQFVEREKTARYVIGTIGKRHKNFRSSKPTVKYFYRYLGEQYEGLEHVGASYDANVVYDGGRYFVQLSSSNPTNSKILFDFPVLNDSLKSLDSGWSHLPQLP
jgi:gentisate 1,2-dioxygenase